MRGLRLLAPALAALLSCAGARAVGGACAPCGSHDLGPFAPGPAWQSVEGDVCCDDADCTTVALDVQAGLTYDLSLCAPEGRAGFDSSLELSDSACAILASNGDAGGPCGTGSRLSWAAPWSGRVFVRVRGSAGATGTFTLAHRSRRVAPTGLTTTWGAFTASAQDCGVHVEIPLADDAKTSLPVTWTWSIAPPPGGFAVPGRGTLTSGAPRAATRILTRLTRPGTFLLSLQASNAAGTWTGTRPVIVVDRAPAVLYPQPSLTAECVAPPVVAPRVRDACDPAPTVTLRETLVPESCPGNKTIYRVWYCADASDNWSAAVQVVRLRDTQPPILRANATLRPCVAPADGGTACFTMAAFNPDATDGCSAPARIRFARITGNEPAGCRGGLDREPDTFVAADGLSACVRAERCDDAAGRTYLVEAIATDACGNASAPAVIGTIVVPPDGSGLACTAPTPGDPGGG